LAAGKKFLELVVVALADTGRGVPNATAALFKRIVGRLL